MDTALNKILAALPDDTKVYPGHEYTKGNVKFALQVLKEDEAVQRLNRLAETEKETQGKSTIGDEKEFNVFMRLGDPAIQKAVGASERVDVMAKLREWKNNS